MSKTVLLMAPPGAGKSTMACTTAVKKPVHVIDIDRKIGSMANLAKLVQNKEVTYWEVTETLAEEGLAARARNLATNKKPSMPPKGWIQIAEFVERLPRNDESRNAGTWVFDSFTAASDHLIPLILYSDPKGVAFMSKREWGAYLQMCKETITALCDLAKANDKDLMILVHESTRDFPTKDAHIMYDSNGERIITGNVESRTIPSVQGQFGDMMPKYFEEVYALKIVVDVSGKPKWVCRVKPDGIRPLRTSYLLDKEEYEPDFQKIWGEEGGENK